MKTKYAITLDEQIVSSARDLQIKISGESNISSLLNKLLGEWVVATKNFLSLSPLPSILELYKQDIKKLGAVSTIETTQDKPDVVKKMMQTTGV